MSLAALKLRLAQVIDPRPTAPGLPTGIAELDALLSGGGLPRGRLTEIVGARGAGKTTLVRRMVENVIESGLWVAVIDATRTLAPRDWAHMSQSNRLWIVRPPDAQRAAWCADVLLRSGAFNLVVLDGAPPLTRSIAVRLTHLARESDAALVAARDGTHASMLGGSLRLRVEPALQRAPEHLRRRWRWRDALPADEAEGALPAATVAIEKGGSITMTPTHTAGGVASQRSHSVEVGRAIGVARRLCTDSEVPDRRGVARRDRWGRPAGALAGDAERLSAAGTRRGESAGRVLPRKRRAAEPDFGRR